MPTSKYIQTAREGYLVLKRYDHYGEHAVSTGKVTEGRAEVILLDCKHGEHKTWIERKDI